MSQITKQNDAQLHAKELEKQAWATTHLRGQRIVLRTLPADKMADYATDMPPSTMLIGTVQDVGEAISSGDKNILMLVTHKVDMEAVDIDYETAMERVASDNGGPVRMVIPAAVVTMDDGILEDLETAMEAADARYSQGLQENRVVEYAGQESVEDVAQNGRQNVGKATIEP